MVRAMFVSIFTTRVLIRVAFIVKGLHSIAIAHSATPYQAPAHNYYQNNWMVGD